MSEDDSGDEPITEVIARLTDDARAFAIAEVTYLRELAIVKAKEARNALMLVSVAMLLAFAGLVAVTVGLVRALTPPLGAIGATAVVGIGSLVIAGACGWIAWRRITALVDPER